MVVTDPLFSETLQYPIPPVVVNTNTINNRTGFIAIKMRYLTHNLFPASSPLGGLSVFLELQGTQ